MNSRNNNLPVIVFIFARGSQFCVLKGRKHRSVKDLIVIIFWEADGHYHSLESMKVDLALDEVVKLERVNRAKRGGGGGGGGGMIYH